MTGDTKKIKGIYIQIEKQLDSIEGKDFDKLVALNMLERKTIDRIVKNQ